MKKLLVLLLVLTLAMSSLAGCGEKSEDGTIKFGTLGPLSGEIAVYGVAVKNGEELAIKEINAAGGILGRDVELISYDNEGDSTKSITLFNRLVDQDNIDALIGPTFSGTSNVINAMANEIKMPMLTPTGTNAAVTIGYDYVYRACFIDPYQGKVAAKFATDNLGAKTAVVFRNISVDYSMGLADNFVTAFPGVILADEGYSDEDNDFKAIITKISAMNPDVIFIPDYKNKVGLIAKQLSEAGVEATLLGGDGWDGVHEDYAEYVNNNYFTNHYTTDDDSAVIQDFIEKYEAEYGETPNALAALAYDAAMIMAAAMEAAGSTDSEKVKEALDATDYAGVTGHITFDENGDTYQKEAVIIKIVDGALQFETKITE